MADTILVGYDGTAAAKGALDWALRHAEAIRADVDVLYVADTAWDTETVSAAPLLHRQGEVVLSGAAFHADSKAPHVTVTSRLVSGDPVRTLSAEAESTAPVMVVLGSHRKDLRERLVASSVSVRVAAAATVPVVVVPEGEAAHRSGIVVGVDGGESAAGVLERALHEGIRMGEAVTVVTAWTLPPMNQLDYTDTTELSTAFEQRAHGVVAEVLSHVEALSPGLIAQAGGVTTSVVFDSPAGALITIAREAALLVIGSHGRRGISRFLLGSVSHDVLVHVPCPTLVLRVT